MRGYDEILTKLQEDYTERTGTQPDRASDIGIRLRVVAGELFSLYAQLNWLKNQMFPNTAQGEFLELHAAQRGLERKSGTKARGEVDLYLQSRMNYDITVPEGTVVSTAGSDPVRFETDEEITIRSGQLSGHVGITALDDGERGNVSEQTISVIVTPVAGVTRVQNDYRTEFGSDTESDEQLRARILDSFVRISNGTNKAYYINEALSVEGVSAASVIAGNRGPGTVDVYITTNTGTVSPGLINRVGARLRQAREVNVDVQVFTMTNVPVNVYMELSVIKGYDFDEVKSGVISALGEYFMTLRGGETVYLSKLSEAIEHVDGVKDHSFVQTLMHDVAINENCIGRLGAVLITERD